MTDPERQAAAVHAGGPRTDQRRRVNGTSGRAIAVQYFRLLESVDSLTGLVTLAGLIFGCGLPGWAIVCWVFNFIEKNWDAGIDEAAKEVKEVL